jgi:hypothetical protein
VRFRLFPLSLVRLVLPGSSSVLHLLHILLRHLEGIRNLHLVDIDRAIWTYLVDLSGFDPTSDSAAFSRPAIRADAILLCVVLEARRFGI